MNNCYRQENSKTTQKGLPKEKQFILLRNGNVECNIYKKAPCRMRISAFEAKSNNSENEDIKIDFLNSKSEVTSNSNSNSNDLDLNGWLATHVNGYYPFSFTLKSIKFYIH